MALQIHGVDVPSLLYGTAWKEDATERLVGEALAAGFRGIDTANQRKHYFEEAVGRAVASALRTGAIARDELFLQTKFTHREGQDHRLPYDPSAPIGVQVEQSFDRSLAHFGVATLDSLILHGPSQRDGLAAQDREAWRAMEGIAAGGRVKLLGASNVTARQVGDLIALTRTPIAFVQNRCYARHGWDREVRALCRAHQIIYQGFSLLTANRDVLAGPAVTAIAKRHDKTPAQTVLRFAQQIGMLPLTGTKDRTHMRQDLEIGEFSLEPEEITAIERAAAA